MTFNKTAKDLGLVDGKICSALLQNDGSILIEVDSDVSAKWFTDEINRKEFCIILLGDGVRFKNRIFNVLVFNVPLNLDPNEDSHCEDINKANNDLEDSTIMTISWAKLVNRRSPNQRSAHLVLSLFSNPEDANYTINQWRHNLQQEMSCQKDQKRTNQMTEMSKVEPPGQGRLRTGEHMQQLHRHTQDCFMPPPACHKVCVLQI